jgi:mono/diheme cytochrome c family protein
MNGLGDHRSVKVAAGVATVALFASVAWANPQTDYTLHCRGCHGPDGSGVAGAAPSLRGDAAKFLRVPGGREYLVRVPGVTQSELSDARTAELINWILLEFSRAELPADFVPYGADEIARLRRSPLTDVEGARRNLVTAIEALEGAATRKQNSH